MCSLKAGPLRCTSKYFMRLEEGAVLQRSNSKALWQCLRPENLKGELRLGKRLERIQFGHNAHEYYMIM